jgi:hypothetical protein
VLVVGIADVVSHPDDERGSTVFGGTGRLRQPANLDGDLRSDLLALPTAEVLVR